MKSFKFNSEGVGSRAYYLFKIKSGYSTVNKLHDAVQSAYVTAARIVNLLLQEGFLEVTGEKWPTYKLTHLGEQEAARFTDWQGDDGPAQKLAPHIPDNVPASEAAPEMSPVAVKPMHLPKDSSDKRGPTIHLPYKSQDQKGASEPKPVNKDLLTRPFMATIPSPELPEKSPGINKDQGSESAGINRNDKYLEAYHSLLHEKYGHQISFKDVLSRMDAA